MAHLTPTDLGRPQPLPPTTDVLVVGAGVAGLYVAWRALLDDPSRRVTVLETLERTGGRLISDLAQFEDVRVKEEEGGMRFTFETMDDLASLLLTLGIDDQVVPFPMGNADGNRLHFRGRSFTQAQAAADDYALWSELYDLAPAERGIDPTSIINLAFMRVLAENPRFDRRPPPRPPEFWQSFRLEGTWAGVRLNEWTMWGLLEAMGYSNECIELLSRLLGFNGTFLSEMNAGVAFQLLLGFLGEQQFRTLESGFSTLPNALARAISDGSIHLGVTAERLRAAPGGRYTLEYTDGTDGYSTRGEITAPKVVLALPRLALERLYTASDLLRHADAERAHRLWDTLQTSTHQPLLKINLYYRDAWWGRQPRGQTPAGFGPNLSDLPLGTVYPFYATEPAAPAAAEYESWLRRTGRQAPPAARAALDEISSRKYGRPAALTIYCDYLNINFWLALQENGGALFDSPMQRASAQARPRTIYPTTEAVVDAATRLLGKLFDTERVPRPLLTSARIWSGSTQPPTEPVGYGVHQWRLHVDDRAVIDDLVEPLPALYTCGEAFSDCQGWVEGALRSADLVLARAFGLDPIREVYRRENGRSASTAIEAAYRTRLEDLIRHHIDPTFDSRRDAAGSALPGDDAT